MSSQFFEVRAAIGSSRDQVVDVVRQGKSFCFCVLANYTVFVHHDHSHWSLADAIGAQWNDIVGEGNASDVGSLIGREPYVAVRFKCHPYMSLDQKAVGNAIREFVKSTRAR